MIGIAFAVNSTGGNQITNSFLFDITMVSALGCGLMAGFFFAFSVVVMRTLASLPPAQGIAAMQSINVTVINPWFLGTFFGTAVACVLLILCALALWQRPAAIYLLAGSLLYLIGTILVTMLFNVPRNNALARADASKPEAVELWRNYLVTWTRWNHVRTAAALAAAAALSIALVEV